MPNWALYFNLQNCSHHHILPHFSKCQLYHVNIILKSFPTSFSLRFAWTMVSFQIGKEVYQGSILSPCLFNLYAEYIMQNARLDEAQAGMKIAGRNINNLRYADDTTLMAESKEILKSLLMKVKEESERPNSTFKTLRSWHLVPSLHGK